MNSEGWGVWLVWLHVSLGWPGAVGRERRGFGSPDAGVVGFNGREVNFSHPGKGSAADGSRSRCGDISFYPEVCPRKGKACTNQAGCTLPVSK